MFLNFQSAGKVEKAGVVYRLEKADVTGNGPFWAAWRYAKQVRAEAERVQAEIPDADLTSVIRLNRELVDGHVRWIAYRLMPDAPGLPPGVFKESFRLRDPSGLLPFQIRAVYYLCNAVLNHGAAADGSDTGIGKTYHALAVCKNLVMRPAIVCRKAGIASWSRACRVMGVSPLFIANWEQVKNGKFPYVKRFLRGASWRYQWAAPAGTLLIFDEAHMGAVDGTQNNLLWLASRGLPSLSLSATFSDRASRLKSLLWIVGMVKSREDFDSWLRLRGHYVNRYGDLESLDDAGDLLEINSALYPRYGFRLSYSDPDVKKYFPDAVYQTEIVTLSLRDTTEQNRLYSELLVKVEHYRGLGKNADALNADLRYRQAAELLKAPVVADLARNYMDQGLSVLIFVNFRETLAYLMQALNTRSAVFGGQEHYKIDREAVIAEFQANRTRLILLMEQAGGQSISLHDLEGGHPRLSLVFPTYDPIVLKQALGRTYRARCRSIPIMKLVYAAGTIEEKVAEVVNRKMGNISALNDGDLMEPDLFSLHGKAVEI